MRLGSAITRECSFELNQKYELGASEIVKYRDGNTVASICGFILSMVLLMLNTSYDTACGI